MRCFGDFWINIKKNAGIRWVAEFKDSACIGHKTHLKTVSPPPSKAVILEVWLPSRSLMRRSGLQKSLISTGRLNIAGLSLEE